MVRLPVSGLEVKLGQLGGAEDILLSEAPSCNTNLALELLSRIACTQDSNNLQWETLAVTDLDYLLLRLRQMVFGDRLRADTLCLATGCGAKVEIAFQIEEYLAYYQPRPVKGLAAASEAGWFQLKDKAIAFRLPTGMDRLAIESHPQPEKFLIQRCVKPTDVSNRLLNRVEKAMETIAPSLCNPLEGNCPECGAKVEVYFDPQQFCLHELRNRSQFIYEDIHLLAMYYRWSEETILKLPCARRRYYAEMIRQERRLI